MIKNSSKHPFIHINKRLDIVPWKAWLIRGGSVILALLFCGILTTLLKANSFGEFYKNLFYGTFGTERRILSLFQNTAMLLIVSLAVTPAFKMRYWNIGAEGQVLISSLMAAVVMYFCGPTIQNNALMLLIMVIVAVCSGAIWAVIPAICKAQWNTNETLFTLMMNYIAARLVSYTINKIVTSGSGTMGIINQSSQMGWMPQLAGYNYIINIIIVAVLALLLAVYLRYSKHGFELTVVGESINTAKYVGINVKKVIIRTMLLSGAICGVAGFLLVSGSAHTITANLVDGRGFTAILVSWLAQFNPLVMFVTSFLVVFIDQGSSEVATMLRFGTSFSEIIIGVFFFFVIASEFFINYSIKINIKKKSKSNDLTEIDQTKKANEKQEDNKEVKA